MQRALHHQERCCRAWVQSQESPLKIAGCGSKQNKLWHLLKLCIEKITYEGSYKQLRTNYATSLLNSSRKPTWRTNSIEVKAQILQVAVPRYHSPGTARVPKHHWVQFWRPPAPRGSQIFINSTTSSSPFIDSPAQFGEVRRSLKPSAHYLETPLPRNYSHFIYTYIYLFIY